MSRNYFQENALDDKSQSDKKDVADSEPGDKPKLDTFLDNTPSDVLESDEPAESQKP